MTDDTKDTTSTTDDVFGKGPKDNNNTGTNDTSKDDLFTSLVGEDKKFKTPEDLAKGKMESDQFIEQLKTEAKQLREELERRPTKEELLDTIRASQKDGTDNQDGLDAEAVRKLINEQVTAYDSEKLATKNIETAAQRMVDLYGAKAGEETVKRARELGMSVEELKQLSARSPQAFYNVMGLDSNASRDTTNKDIDSNIDTEKFKPPGGDNSNMDNPKTWADFEALRKSNPKKYFSPKVQNEIFKLRKEKGEGFYNS